MRVRWLLLGLLVLQGLDLLLTNLLLGGGIRTDVYEANPLAQRILSAGGWKALAGFKVACTLVALSAALLVVRWRPAAGRRLLATLCLLMLGVVGYSGVLATGSSAGEQRELAQLLGREQEIIKAQESLQRFVEDRNALCLALLEGKLSLLEAVEQHQVLVSRHQPDFLPPLRRTMPPPDEPAAQASYLLLQVNRLLQYDTTGKLPRYRLAELEAEAARLVQVRASARGV